MPHRAQGIADSRVAFAGGYALYARQSSVELPSEVEVILTGDYKARDMKINEATLDQMIENHRKSGVDPAIDREHESWSMFGSHSPEARGWVKALRKEKSKSDGRRTALVADVEWTDLGEQAIRAKHFRYISAGMDLKGKDRLSGKDIGAMLDHVALVKNPYVQGMTPLSFSNSPQIVAGEKAMEMLTQFCKVLGLSADAEEGEVLAAVQRHGEFARELVKLTGEQPGPQLLGTIAAWKHAEAQVTALRDEMAALKADGRKREADTLVRQGLESGQITPAMKDWALSMGASDDGMVALKKYLETAPKQIPMVEKAQPATVAEKKTALTKEAVRIARMLGNDPEAVAKFAAEHPMSGAKPEGWDDNDDEATAAKAG